MATYSVTPWSQVAMFLFRILFEQMYQIVVYVLSHTSIWKRIDTSYSYETIIITYNTASPSTILDVTKCFEDVMSNHDDALQVLLSACVLSGNTGTVPQVNLQVSQQVAPL